MDEEFEEIRRVHAELWLRLMESGALIATICADNEQVRIANNGERNQEDKFEEYSLNTEDTMAQIISIANEIIESQQ